MGGIYNNNRILSSIKTRKSRSTGSTKLASTSNSATNVLLMNMRLTIPTKAGLAKVILLSILQTIMTIKIDFNPAVQQSGANVTRSSVIRSSKPKSLRNAKSCQIIIYNNKYFLGTIKLLTNERDPKTEVNNDLRL